MPLLRGFSKVDEEGKIVIPSNIREKAGISVGSLVGIKVIRIKGSSRWPHIIVHVPGVDLRLSMLQVVTAEERSQIDDEARLILTDSILGEAKLEPNYRVEIKLVGSKGSPWAVIYNRGPNRLTTLQEKIGRLGKNRRCPEKWQTQKWDY